MGGGIDNWPLQSPQRVSLQRKRLAGNVWGRISHSCPCWGGSSVPLGVSDSLVVKAWMGNPPTMQLNKVPFFLRWIFCPSNPIVIMGVSPGVDASDLLLTITYKMLIWWLSVWWQTFFFCDKRLWWFLIHVFHCSFCMHKIQKPYLIKSTCFIVF